MSAPSHKAQADVGVPQAVRRPRSAFAIEPKILFVKDRLGKLPFVIRTVFGADYGCSIRKRIWLLTEGSVP